MDDVLIAPGYAFMDADPSRDEHDWKYTIWGTHHALMMDEDLFLLGQDWFTDNPPPDGQSFDSSPRNAPARQHTIDTAMLVSPLESLSSFLPKAAVLVSARQHTINTALLLSPLESLSPSLPKAAVLVSNSAQGASPYSPFGPGPRSLGPSVDTAYKDQLMQGYPGDSPIARERRAILSRTILNEMAQVPTSAHNIKKLADIHRPTDEVPDDALPSSGKKSGTLALRCAWAACDHYCARPDRLKTHVFTHIGFKPFPCDRSCGDPHW